MLVISRKTHETIVFPGLGITVRVADIKSNAVRIGIDAPREVPILRGELQARAEEWAEAPAATPTSAEDALTNVSKLVGLARLQAEAGRAYEAEATLIAAQKELEQVRRRAETPASRRAKRCKALLVEDNDNERELLARFLRQAGVDVDTAGDGADALDYLRNKTPDVVLLDMGLPRCDGPTAVREIRRDPRTAGLKVYAVSGHLPDEYDLGRGVDGWFHKPIDPEALVRSLKEGLTLATPGV